MARSKKQTYITVDKIVNLTDRTVNLYDSLGNIVTLRPSGLVELPPCQKNVAYLVYWDLYQSAKKTGRRADDLVCASRPETGRGGIPVSSIIRYNDSARVYPKGES